MDKLLTAENIKTIAMTVVVMLSGGNLYLGKVNEDDIKRSIIEIHAVHEQLEPMLDRQKRLEDYLKQLTGKNQ
jgi:hypothetical protein